MMNKPIIWRFGGGEPGLRSISQEEFLHLTSGEAEGKIVSVNDAYRLVGWVYRCVQLRANTIAGLPWSVRRGEEEVELWYELTPALRAIEFALCLCGAAYALKLRRGKLVADLQPLNPNTMVTLADSRQGITGFEQRVGGQTQRFASEDIVFIRYLHPTDDLGPGISPAAVALAAARLAHYSNTFLAKFFENGAMPAVILTTEQPLAEADAERVRTWWQRAFGGVQRSWRTAILQKGLEPRVVGTSVRDLAVGPLLAEARQQIAVAFGIPQTLLEDAANFATAREHKLSFYYETIFPEARLIEAALNEQLFAELGLEFTFQYGQVEAIQQDEAVKAQALMQLVGAGIITADEAREQMGFEPRAPAPVPIATPSQPSAEEQPPVAARGLGRDAIQELARWRDKAARRGWDVEFEIHSIPGWLAEAVRRRLADGCEREAFAPALRGFSRNKAEEGLRQKIVAVLSDYEPAIAKAVGRGEMPDDKVTEMQNRLISVITASLAAIVADAALADAVEVGVGLDYDDLLLDATSWAQSYTYDLVKGITEKTVAQLQAIIGQVTQGQLAPTDAELLLAPLFGDVRAGMIATTEVTRALSQATEIYTKQLREAGHKIVVRWLTEEDERVCDICGPLDHKLEDVWREVSPDGPPAHVNCRCKTVIEVAR
jgi:HK97 family phage portal protein